MPRPACETSGWQLIAGPGFKLRWASSEISVHHSRPSCQPQKLIWSTQIQQQRRMEAAWEVKKNNNNNNKLVTHLAFHLRKYVNTGQNETGYCRMRWETQTKWHHIRLLLYSATIFKLVTFKTTTAVKNHLGWLVFNTKCWKTAHTQVAWPFENLHTNG